MDVGRSLRQHRVQNMMVIGLAFCGLSGPVELAPTCRVRVHKSGGVVLVAARAAACAGPKALRAAWGVPVHSEARAELHADPGVPGLPVRCRHKRMT